MKPGTPAHDGDFGWPFGVNSFTEPHLLRPGEASLAINVAKNPRTSGWSHRPAFTHIDIKWSSVEDKKLWRNGPTMATGFQHKSPIIYSVSGGRVFRFVPSGRRTLVGECLTHQQMMASAAGWVTGVPGGAIIQDGKNSPLYCRGRSVVRVGTTRQDIRIGRAGLFLHGRYVYVSMDQTALLVSDIDDPVSMQEAVDTNLYGWYTPDRSDRIIGLAKHRIASNDVELGNVIFSTDTDIYAVDIRGDRREWGGGAGRVSVSIPDISFAGERAVATVNSNVVFMSAQKDINLCMINQLAAQYQRADAFSGQFLEADEWFDSGLRDRAVVASYGADLLVAASPRMHGARVHHRWILSFRAVKGTDEGLKFQGGWLGPRVTDIASSPEFGGFLVSGITDDGSIGFWSLTDMVYDTDSAGAARHIHSAVATRGYTHREMFQPKTRGGQEVYLHNVCGPVSLRVSHRLVVRGEWQSVREKSFTMSNTGTVGPIGFGDSDAVNAVPGSRTDEFYAEQVLVQWAGAATLAGVASAATYSVPSSMGVDFGADTVTPAEFDPLAPCTANAPMLIPSKYL